MLLIAHAATLNNSLQIKIAQHFGVWIITSDTYYIVMPGRPLGDHFHIRIRFSDSILPHKLSGGWWCWRGGKEIAFVSLTPSLSVKCLFPGFNHKKNWILWCGRKQIEYDNPLAWHMIERMNGYSGETRNQLQLIWSWLQVRSCMPINLGETSLSLPFPFSLVGSSFTVHLYFRCILKKGFI